MFALEITHTFQSVEDDEIQTRFEETEIHIKNGDYGEVMLSRTDFEAIVAQYRAYQNAENTYNAFTSEAA